MLAILSTFLVVCAVLGSFVLLFAVPLLVQYFKPLKRVTDGVGTEADTKRGFKKKDVPQNVDVIVIGSGMGGLTAACTLARQGKKVLVLEQHDRLGGCTHVFEEHGFEFDTGVHYLGADLMDKSKPVRKLVDIMTDGRVEFQSLDDNYDVSVFGDEEIGWCGAKNGKSGIARMSERLKARFPGAEEAKAIDTFFKAAEWVSLVPTGMWLATRILPRWLGPVAKLMAAPFHAWSRTTTEAFLNSLTSNKELKAALAYKYGDLGLPPSQCSSAIDMLVVNHYKDGACYPIGGSLMFARAAVAVINALGGAAFVRAPVGSLIYEDGRVTGVRMQRNDMEIRAKTVISTTGVYSTFTKLLPPPARHLVSEGISAMQSKHVKQSIGHFNLFVGLDADSEVLNLPASNYWCFPDFNIEAGRANWFRRDADSVAAAFIGFPSAKDPTWKERFPGKATCVVVSECPYSWVEKWREGRLHHRGDDYEAFKAEIMEKLLAIAYRRFPQLRGHVVHKEMGTPVTTEYYIAAMQGASYGLAHNPERFDQAWLRPSTPIPGLVLGGQDVITAGVAAGAVGGFLAAGAVCKSTYYKFINCLI